MIRGVYTPSLEFQRTPFRLYTLEDADINIICDPVDFKIQLTSSYWINMHLSLNIKSYLYSNHAQNWCTQLNIPFIDQSFSNIPNWRSKFCSFARHLADCVRSGDLKRMEVIDGTGWSKWNPKLTSSNILTSAAYPPGNCAHIPSNQGTQESPWFFTFFPRFGGICNRFLEGFSQAQTTILSNHRRRWKMRMLSWNPGKTAKSLRWALQLEDHQWAVVGFVYTIFLMGMWWQFVHKCVWFVGCL